MNRSIVVLAGLLASTAALGDEPQGAPPLVYAGTVTGAGEAATVRVALYDGADGGELCAGEAVALGGRFVVDLPCAQAVGASAEVWSEVAVDGAPMPRTRVGAVPVALRATVAEGASGALAATLESLALATGKIATLDARIAALESAQAQTVLTVKAAAGDAADALDAAQAAQAAADAAGKTAGGAQVAATQATAAAAAAQATATAAQAAAVSAQAQVASVVPKPPVKCQSAAVKIEVPLSVQAPAGALLVVVNARISGIANIGTPLKYAIRVDGKAAATVDATSLSMYDARIDATAVADVPAGLHTVDLVPVDGMAICGAGNCRVTVCSLPQ